MPAVVMDRERQRLAEMLAGKYCEDRKLGRAAESDMITPHMCHLASPTLKETGERSRGKQRDRQRYDGLRFSDITDTLQDDPSHLRTSNHTSQFLDPISLQNGSAVISDRSYYPKCIVNSFI